MKKHSIYDQLIDQPLINDAAYRYKKLVLYANGKQDIESYKKAFGVPVKDDAVEYLKIRHALVGTIEIAWATEAVEIIGMNGFENKYIDFNSLSGLKMQMWNSKVDEFIYIKRAETNGLPVEIIKSNAKKEQEAITVKLVTLKLLGEDENYVELDFKDMGMFIPVKKRK